MTAARVAAAGAVLAIGALCACGTPAAAPTPTPVVAPAPAAVPVPPASHDLTGAWSGAGSDVQGDELMTWTVAQTGNTVAGIAQLRPDNVTDGSCASCHKLTSGTFSGTLSGSTLTIAIVFPSGNPGVPTPMCTITFDATAPSVSADRISATYSGNDTCEGSFAGGVFTMTRQPQSAGESTVHKRPPDGGR
jgi:hypothetical protein